MTEPLKNCPRCSAPAVLSATQCASCGHTYRTKFPLPDATQQTQMQQAAPMLRTPPAGAPYTMQNALGNSTDTYLAEATRQYRALNWWFIIGILTSAGVIGIAMIIYSIIQKPALRRRVAEYGINAEAWAKPMDAELWRMAAWTAAVPVCLIGGCITLSVIGGTIQGAGEAYGKWGMSQQQKATDIHARETYLQSSGIAYNHAINCHTDAELLAELGTPTRRNPNQIGGEFWHYAVADGGDLRVAVGPDHSAGDATITNEAELLARMRQTGQ